MNRASILRLRAEVLSDLEALHARADEVAAVEQVEHDSHRIALALHHAYSAVESALARIAREIEGSSLEGPHWHKALLDSSALEVPTVRPALLAADTVRDLHELRGFRHFLRHGYAVELDPEELARHRQTLERLRGAVSRDFKVVLAWLAECAEQL